MGGARGSTLWSLQGEHFVSFLMLVEGVSNKLFLSVLSWAKRFDEGKTFVFLSFWLGKVDMLDKFHFVALGVFGEMRPLFWVLCIIITQSVDLNLYDNNIIKIILGDNEARTIATYVCLCWTLWPNWLLIYNQLSSSFFGDSFLTNRI